MLVRQSSAGVAFEYDAAEVDGEGCCMSENTQDGAAPSEPARPEPVECGKSALNEFVARTKHTISGARLTVERCPDASMARTVKGAAVTGGVLAAGSFLLRRSHFFLIAAGIGGAVLGALSARYHVAFDWDPDRAFGGEKPGPEYR